MLSDDIFAEYDARKMRPEAVRAFGRDLFVRKWSARIRAIWEALVFERDGSAKPEAKREFFLAATAVCSLVDSDGAPVFYRLTDLDELPMSFDQVVEEYRLATARVAQLDAVELEKVYAVCARFNGLDKDAVEQAEKNSGATPS